MLYEMRSYNINPERWDEFLAWVDTWGIPVLVDQFGYRMVGRWQTVPKAGEAAPATNYHYMLAWESEEERSLRHALVDASEDWKAAWAETLDPDTGESKYFLRISSVLLQPLAGSPLQ